MFQIGEDKTEYRLISKEGVSTAEFEGKTILKVSKEALTLLAQQGFHDVEFMLRREHNLHLQERQNLTIILQESDHWLIQSRKFLVRFILAKPFIIVSSVGCTDINI